MLVEDRNRFGAKNLAAGRANRSDREIRIDLPQRGGDEIAPLVRLHDDRVPLPESKRFDDLPRPAFRRRAQRAIVEDVEERPTVEREGTPRDDDTCIVARVVGGDRRVDAHDDPFEIARGFENSSRVDRLLLP